VFDGPEERNNRPDRAKKGESKMNMEMIKKTLVIAGAAALTATGAMAADATIGVDFASSYVFRGVTFNDNPVLQPYLEVEGLSIAGKAITVGTWANYDFTNTGTGDPQSGDFGEIDYYASVDLGAGFGMGYCQYTYPTIEGDSDKEMSLSYGTEVAGVELSAAAYYMVGGAYAESLYLEVGAGYGVDISDDLSASFGATLGCQAVSEEEGAADTEEGFSVYTVSAGLAYALNETTELTTSLTYVGAIDNEVVDVDKEVVAVVGVSYKF
jgi:uncharacterized protein (TIGR02001 family)